MSYKQKMQEEWLLRGPYLSEIVAEKKDERKRKIRKLAVIIPAYQNNEILIKHINKLSNQTYQDFDFIIIYGVNDQFITCPDWASILHIRECIRNGAAGAYYLGERYAFEEKYPFIILADSDCMPNSKNLIEKILKSLEEKSHAAFAKVSYSEKTVGINIHHYAGIRRELLEKVGFTFFPFNSGGEDFDFINRIMRTGFRKEFIETSVSRIPNEPFVLKDQHTLHHYTKGNILHFFLTKSYIKTFLAMFAHLMSGLAFLMLGKPRITKRYLKTAWSIANIKFYREELDDFKAPIAVHVQEKCLPDIIVDRDKEIEVLVLSKLSISKIMDMMFELVKNKYLGKKLLFIENCNILSLPKMLLAKSSHIKVGKKIYRIAPGRSYTSIILGLFLIGLAFLPVTLISFLLVIMGFVNIAIKGIKSEMYGINSL